MYPLPGRRAFNSTMLLAPIGHTDCATQHAALRETMLLLEESNTLVIAESERTYATDIFAHVCSTSCRMLSR